MNGICEKCQLPCAECAGTTQDCVTCDSSISRAIFKYEKRCYAECPEGTGPIPAENSCFKCQPGCDLCSYEDEGVCLSCTPPALVYKGKCVAECPGPNGPGGIVANEDNTSCRPWQLSDWGWVPFPFLICAAIFTTICLFGMSKRRAFVEKGKVITRPRQNTLTCIIVALAPLQFLATAV